MLPTRLTGGSTGASRALPLRAAFAISRAIFFALSGLLSACKRLSLRAISFSSFRFALVVSHFF
jgi:hypothetical protein